MESITKFAAILFSIAAGMVGGAPVHKAPVPKPPVQQPVRGVKALENKQIPAFSMKTIDGKKITDQTLRGKVVVLDFWASWCGPCKEASPVMDMLQKKYAANKVQIIGVNCLEEKPGSSFAKKYQAQHKYSFTFTFDNDPITKKWDIAGVPTFVVIDRKGKVAYTADYWTPQIKTDLIAVVDRLAKS